MVQPQVLLLVDGSEQNQSNYRHWLSSTLAGWGAECPLTVVECDRGETALHWCQTDAVAAILLNDNLPDMRALALIQQLHQTRQDVVPAIALLVAEGDVSTAVAAMKQGVFDCLEISRINADTLCSLTQSLLQNAYLPVSLRVAQGGYTARENEARLRAVLAAIPDLLLLYSKDGVYLDCVKQNPSINALVPTSSMVGQHLRELLPLSISQRHEQAIQQLFETGEIQIYEQQIQIGDRIQHEEIRMAPYGENAVLMMVRDITERKHTENALYRSEATNLAILNAVPDLLIRMTREGQYQELCSGGAVKIIHPPQDHLPTVYDVLPPDIAAERLFYAERALTTGQMQRYEQQLQIDNVTCYEEVRLIPCSVNEVLVIVRDITDRWHAEAALRQNKEILAQRERYLSALVQVQQQLLTPNGDRVAYDNVLSLLGQAAEASRAYVFINSRDGEGRLRGSQQAEWCAPGILSQEAPALQTLLYAAVCPRWETVLGSGGAVSGLVSEFPDSEQASLVAQQIQSVLLLPLMVRGEFFGFLRFDNCVEARLWDPSEQVLLQAGTTALSLAIERQMTEADLRHSEQLYSTLVNNFPNGAVLLFDHQLRFLVAGGLGLKTVELARDELEGKTIWEVFSAEVCELLEPLYHRTLSGQETVTELCYCDRWYMAHYLPLLDEQGRVMAGMAMTQDITDRKQAEQTLQTLNHELEIRVAQRTAELQANQDLRDAIFNESTDAIFLVDAQTRLTLDCNRRAVELFEAKSKADLIGIDGCILQRYPFSIEESEKIQHVVNDQGCWSLELEYITQTGRTFWGNMAAKAIRVADHHMHLVRVTDISDRKQAEQLVYSQKEFLSRLITIVPNLVFVKDWEGRFQLVNQATADIYHTTIDNLIGKTDADFNPNQAEVAAYLAADQEVMTNGQTKVIFEETITSPSGEQRYFQTIKVPIVSADGRTQQLLGVSTDITEHKTMQALLVDTNRRLTRVNTELERATQLKDEFLANMSHELRTPLNAILGMSEGLQDDVYGPVNDRQRRAIVTIERSGRHLLELINEILDLSKIESGHLELNLNPVHVEALCNSSITFVRHQAFQKRLTLTLSVTDSISTIQADERRMRQVLINLLTNAVKFTPTGGKVALEVTREQIGSSSWICFAITDTGIGIAATDLDKLFQPFVQIDSSLNRQYAGTGLGLALVRRIIELHGGLIKVSSQPGHGSCFTVKLPQLDSSFTPMVLSLDQALEPTRPVQREFPSASPLVLLAEDQATNVETVTDYLDALGYRLIVAQNGNEAVAIAQSHHPDLILMDIQMPGMDGLEAIRQIRAIAPLQQKPIIALTALAMAGDEDRCLTAGANAYLSKPIKLKHLASTMTTLLKR